MAYLFVRKVGEICIAADAVKVHRVSALCLYCERDVDSLPMGSCDLGTSGEKQPCKDLGDRCISLLTAIRDSYEGMEGAAAPQILEQVDPCVDLSDAS